MKTTISEVQIKGISSFLPKNVFEIHHLGNLYGQKKIQRIIKSTGVERVHLVDSQTTASDLCINAAEHLIKELNIEKKSIDAIVFLSISADYRAPATSVIIQDRLGLSQDTVAFDINYGCSAFIYGLYQAAMLLDSGGCTRVLLCNGDVQSKLINLKDRSMRAIVGDAGTATILEKGSSVFNFVIKSNGAGYKNLFIPAGGTRIPFSKETCEEIEDDDGNIRSKNDIYMNGMEVLKFSLKEVPKIVEEVMTMANWSKNDGEIYTFHQPNKLILEYLRDALKVEEKSMPIALSDTGNTGSASIPLMLTIEHQRLAKEKHLDKVVACGFGVGMSWGAATIDLSNTLICDPI